MAAVIEEEAAAQAAAAERERERCKGRLTGQLQQQHKKQQQQHMSVGSVGSVRDSGNTVADTRGDRVVKYEGQPFGRAPLYPDM
jgi:hypothetical protein